MKDLITTMAAMAILMIFLMQFAVNQTLAVKILAADKLVLNCHNAILSGKQWQEDTSDLKNDIAKCMGCTKEEVLISTEDEGNMKVSITAPIRNVIACGKFLGITEEENVAYYSSGFKVEERKNPITI